MPDAALRGRRRGGRVACGRQCGNEQDSSDDTTVVHAYM